MFGLKKIHFIQALGAAVAVYALFHVVAFSFEAFMHIIQSFAAWCRYALLPLAEEIAFIVFVGYIFFMAIVSSKRDA